MATDFFVTDLCNVTNTLMTDLFESVTASAQAGGDMKTCLRSGLAAISTWDDATWDAKVIEPVVKLATSVEAAKANYECWAYTVIRDVVKPKLEAGGTSSSLRTKLSSPKAFLQCFFERLTAETALQTGNFFSASMEEKEAVVRRVAQDTLERKCIQVLSLDSIGAPPPPPPPPPPQPVAQSSPKEADTDDEADDDEAPLEEVGGGQDMLSALDDIGASDSVSQVQHVAPTAISVPAVTAVQNQAVSIASKGRGGVVITDDAKSVASSYTIPILEL